ncbi:ATP-binding protein [Psychroserpens mesophilus]|uniref:sensor histidine kinase n=1 Tax=Psychroserpens mesophilus TaxID=325473 RepID=UPI003F4982B3
MKSISTILPKTKKYNVSLGISIVLLLLIFIFITFEILQLQKSGEVIAKNIQETRSLHQLIFNLKDVESNYYKSDLTRSYLDSIETSNASLIKTLDRNYKVYDSFLMNHKALYSHLNVFLSFDNTTEDLEQSISQYFSKGSKYKQALIDEHEEKLKSDIGHFVALNKAKPILFILASLIAMLVIILSLYKLYIAKKIINEKSSVLDSILENTNDVAIFYEPVFDDNHKLKDFRITYASKTNALITDVTDKNIVGKKASELFPFLKTSDLFDQLIYAFENQEIFEKVIEVSINNENRSFKVRYIPVETGLQVIVTELTELYANQKKLETTNKDLYLKNTLFHEAEEVAKLGSYVWYMDEDFSQMSDNVFRILGFEPQSFRMSAEKFREFTHPEDLIEYDNQLKQAIENSKPINFVFRVITNDNQIKYLYTRGDFGLRDGKKIMVGVIQDITENKGIEHKLKSRNIELTQRNAELDSFNRVASHDLQEPLRKIQMFISRINDFEAENLSEKVKTYFSKIEKASSRMRSLINNLLALSRIDNKDYEYELVDLNIVLNEVLDVFSETIDDLGIQIKIDNLPEINAIPFLMEQLFTNLIGNAIKYRSTQKSVKIIVEYSKVHSKQIPQEFIKTHTYYHCIKIMDNGIGFDQQENSNIFELFHRLHNKNEYSGTGLGLAICKKIVLKHHGHIYATGIPAKGSIFTIYLPSGNLKLHTN